MIQENTLIARNPGLKLSGFDAAERFGEKYLARLDSSGRVFAISPASYLLLVHLDGVVRVRDLYERHRVNAPIERFILELERLLKHGLVTLPNEPSSFVDSSQSLHDHLKTAILARVTVLSAQNASMVAHSLKGLFAPTRMAWAIGFVAISKVMYITLYFRGDWTRLPELLSPRNANLQQQVQYFLESDPLKLLVFLILVVSLFLAHELGHAAASAFYGSRVGAIGAGLYYSLLVFYTDATDTWSLKRHERVAVDLGGIYLQQVYSAFIAIAYVAAPSTPLITVLLFSEFITLINLIPFLKFDGYWALNDALGMVNLQGDGQRLALNFLRRSWARRRSFQGAAIKLRSLSRVDVTLIAYSLASVTFFVGLTFYAVANREQLFFNTKSFVQIIFEALTFKEFSLRRAVVALFFLPTVIYLGAVLRLTWRKGRTLLSASRVTEAPK